jgi:hypothetical protein
MDVAMSTKKCILAIRGQSIAKIAGKAKQMEMGEGERRSCGTAEAMP